MTATATVTPSSPATALDDPVAGPEGLDEAALKAIEGRVLWLATRIIDHANRERPGAGLKVGGHPASSASMTSLMTALWFGHLDAQDRVAVKPHASPVLHAIQYLLGNLDRDDLTTLRAFGGLQAYPSITKDRFDVDFATGSVGLRRRRATVRRGHPTLRRRTLRSPTRRALHRTARRRRTGRGQCLGGDHRPDLAG